MSIRREFRQNADRMTLHGKIILGGGGYMVFASIYPEYALSYSGLLTYAVLCANLYFGFNPEARQRLYSRMAGTRRRLHLDKA